MENKENSQSTNNLRNLRVRLRLKVQVLRHIKIIYVYIGSQKTLVNECDELTPPMRLHVLLTCLLTLSIEVENALCVPSFVV